MGLKKLCVSTKGKSPWYYYMRKKLFCEGKTVPYVNWISTEYCHLGSHLLFSSALAVSRTNTWEFLLLSWACMILEKPVTSACIPNILKPLVYSCYIGCDIYFRWSLLSSSRWLLSPPSLSASECDSNGWKNPIKFQTFYIVMCQDIIERC